MTPYLRLLAVLLTLAAAPATLVPVHDALAADEEGVPVTVKVLDEEGKPVPTAVVRHPLEADRHRVNTFDGTFTTSVLYLPDGTEMKFLKGMELELEISAPGYVNERIKYVIRKRKNVVEVVLRKMDLDAALEQEEEDVVIQFGRDKPIDGSAADPAN